MKVMKISSVLLLFLLVFGAVETKAGCGDINLDGKVNILDVLEYLQYKLHYEHIYPPPPPIPMELGDITGDRTINILDIIALIDNIFRCQVDCEERMRCPSYNHTDFSGGCIDGDGDEEVIFEVNGTSLTVYHNNAYYNCCLDYFVDYGIRGGHIVAYERDFGDPCDCDCYFDLTSTLNDIEPGIYGVEFYGIDGTLLKQENLEFGPVPELSGSTHSGCLSSKTGSIQYDYANGNLHLAHNGVVFNCSAELDGIDVTFEQIGDTLRFIETNLSNQGLYCLCEFDITADVINLAPGNYVAEIYSVDVGGTEPVLQDRRDLILE